MKGWMAGKLRVLSLLGVCCSSLCFLALPLLAVWVPASSWLHNETLTRLMLAMFLLMALGGGYAAYSHHGRRGPGICALLGAGLLVCAAWGAWPVPAGWSGLALLIAAWLWDLLLMKAAHGQA